MPNVYDFRSGRSIKGVNPQSVGDWLEQLRKEKGVLVPADVVEAAKDPDCPGHSAFTWDDSEAAHKHRLDEARRLIVSIKVLNSPTAKPTIAYVSVKTPDKGRTYLPSVEAMTNEDLKARVLDEIHSAIESIQRRYAHFEEIANLLAGLKKAVG